MRLVGREHRSSECSRIAGASLLLLHREGWGHSGCSRLDSTSTRDARAAGVWNNGAAKDTLNG